ncbi:hypothetical protein COF80_32200 [Bacillus toyonensis]|uniref:hypothetical protein n=1 Tax=Bacillus toyonensis TaxID=155322 RepID=UPI000BF1545C|nr:hypothetical protein [Bacillus toyonensis]PEM42366.1 hypothetical protein CN636_20660 [Bacillus toyonensis]PHE79929.1 hypothetical protein COF80_32200 [Bacillus toyonensis]
MIHRYEIIFSLMYNDKVTDLQSVTIPAGSLEYATEKLNKEIQRRFGYCEVLIYSTSLYVAENERYSIIN